MEEGEEDREGRKGERGMENVTGVEKGGDDEKFQLSNFLPPSSHS